ncbi:MAG: hypothetical protein RLZZ612_421 [Pseudomonadota bacterium]|jgi:hypothetical protein
MKPYLKTIYKTLLGLRGAVTLACGLLGLPLLSAQTPASPSVAASPQLSWSGPRHASCESYQKPNLKPLYEAKVIDEHLEKVLGLDPNKVQIFYRWERPVRYYLEVPAEYPELVKLFEAQVAEVAKYSGLSIARHDKPYIERKDEKLNDRSKWPEGLSTNAVVVWTTDMDNTLDTPLVKKLNEGLSGSTKQAQRDWEQMNKENNGRKSYLGFSNYGFDPDGMKFVFLLNGQALDKSLKKKLLPRPSMRILLDASVSLVSMSRNAGNIPSVQNTEVDVLTNFDKQFLRVMYGKHVHSGMTLLRAKRLMYQELIDCFNAKPAN